MSTLMRKLMIANGIALALTSMAITTSAQARHQDDYEYSHHYERCDNCGTVRSIEHIRDRNKHFGGGTILGAVVGGALGNQVGRGDGRTAATIVGAVAGGAVGHNVESNHRRHYEAYRISVRMDGGRIYTYDQDTSNGLRSGDRVVVEDGYVQPQR